MAHVRSEERAAASALAALLKKYKRGVDWRPGDDPPDFVFTVDGNRLWAVEVTRFEQYLEQDHKVYSRPEIEAFARALWDSISIAVSDMPHPEYSLDIFGPVTNVSKQSIVRAAVQHIRKGRKETLDLEPTGLIQLRFISDSGNIEVLVGPRTSSQTPGTDRLLANIRASLSHTVDRILEHKLPLMRQLSEFDIRLMLIWAEHVPPPGPSRIKDILQDKKVTSTDVDSIVIVWENEAHCVADPSHLFADGN